MDVKKIFNNKLIQAGSWYTFTNLFVQGLAFLSIPIFTRLLSTSDYGMISLFGTWVGLFSVFVSLDLAWSVQRAKFDFADSYDSYISSVAFLSILLFFGFGVLFIIFENFFVTLTGLQRSLFYFMILQSYFTFIQNFALGKFRVEYNYKFISVVSVLKSSPFLCVNSSAVNLSS